MKKRLLILLLFVFPLGQLARIDVGNGIAILINDVTVFLVVASYFVLERKKLKEVLTTPLTKPIAVFSFVAFLSLLLQIGNLTQQQFLIAFLYLVRFISYASLYFVIKDIPKALKEFVLKGLLVDAGVLIILGFMQYFFYPNLRNLYYLGWDEHLYRLFSTMLDPNFFGGIAVLASILTVSLALQAKDTNKKLIYFVTSFLSLVALLLTYSRGSFISFIAGISMFTMFTHYKKYILIFITLFLIGFFLLPKDFGGEGVRLLRTASINERLLSAQRAWHIFLDQPVFGVGFNTYRYAQQKAGFATEGKFGESHAGAGTDNSFLFVLATTGIVGFITYIYLWYRIIIVAKHAGFVIASICAIFAHALFVNSLFYPFVMEWLWIIVGLVSVGRKPLALV